MPITRLNNVLLEGNIIRYCSFEFPWLHSLGEKIRKKESTCLLVPRAFGDVPGFAEWLGFEVRERFKTGKVRIFGDSFEEMQQEFTDLLVPDFRSGCRSGSAEWFQELFSIFQRENPGVVETRIVIFQVADTSDWEWYVRLCRAQEDVGISAATTILVTNHAPAEIGIPIFYSPPHLFANMDKLPDPDQDASFWNSILNSFNSLWESAGIPSIAESLNGRLKESQLNWGEAGYSAKRDNVLYSQALESYILDDKEIGRLRELIRPVSGPVKMYPFTSALDERLWHKGCLQFQGTRMEITPLAARYLSRKAGLLSPDEQMALERGRFNNAALARWISGWASTVEENLRQIILTIGDGEFCKFLQQEPPYNKKFSTRYDELMAGDGFNIRVAGISIAETIDLVKFVTIQPKYVKWKQNLEDWRHARNSVVHNRIVDSEVIRKISRMVNLLQRDGVV